MPLEANYNVSIFVELINHSAILIYISIAPPRIISQKVISSRFQIRINYSAYLYAKF